MTRGEAVFSIKKRLLEINKSHAFFLTEVLPDGNVKAVFYWEGVSDAVLMAKVVDIYATKNLVEKSS